MDSFSISLATPSPYLASPMADPVDKLIEEFNGVGSRPGSSGQALAGGPGLWSWRTMGTEGIGRTVDVVSDRCPACRRPPSASIALWR